jgi:hypothetical protein
MFEPLNWRVESLLLGWTSERFVGGLHRLQEKEKARPGLRKTDYKRGDGIRS